MIGTSISNDISMSFFEQAKKNEKRAPAIDDAPIAGIALI
jgi:hypothetical protein